MHRDIDTIKDRVRSLISDVEVRQLQCAHAADDDGLWFFRRAGKKDEIQLESSTGDLPFLVEHDRTKAGKGKTVITVEEAVQEVQAFLVQTK